MTDPFTDRESVDLGFAGDGDDMHVAPRLEAQLKCTACDVLCETELRFPLKVKNYNDLRTVRVMVPRILIVVCVPGSVAAWLSASEFKTVLKHSGYWISLRGEPETSNTQKVTVAIPRTNRFTPEALSTIMARIATGQLL